MRPAIFLDRDGTVIEERHYLCDPAGVVLLPTVAEAIGLLRGRGFACVVVSNQSGIGRGMFTVEAFGRVQAEVDRQLAAAGAALDGCYFCPEAPRGEDRTAVEHPDRKPGPGMLLRAARELGLDLGRSWMVGDMLSDLLAGRNAGCRGSILVRTGYGSRLEPPAGAADHVAADLMGAAAWILGRDVPGAEGATRAPSAQAGATKGISG